MNTLENILELTDEKFNQKMKGEINFHLLIEHEDSIDRLKKLFKRSISSQELSGYMETILRRILAIDSNDLSTLIILSWELWFLGEEEESQNFLSRAKLVSPGNKWVLYLETALSSNVEIKISILEKLLEKEPHNQQIFHNLNTLKSGISNSVLAFNFDECMSSW